MTSQAFLTGEAIAGLRRATGRDAYSSDSDNTIQRPTNRGNKLKRKAEYVHEGMLDIPNGLKAYKKRITHAGYERTILKRNPQRYDADGDELEDDDVDEQADADAASRNPYSHIKLEELLAPLTSAADLPQHPSLSIPYTSKTLTEMTRQACIMLHREKRSLYAVRNLLTKFRGDNAFISCRSLNARIDEDIFDIKSVYNELSTFKVRHHATKSITASPLDGGSTNSSSDMVNGIRSQDNYDTTDDQAVAETSVTVSGHNTSTEDTAEPALGAAAAHTSEPMAFQPTHSPMVDGNEPKSHSPRMAIEEIEDGDAAVGPEATVGDDNPSYQGQTDRHTIPPSKLAQEAAHAQSPIADIAQSDQAPNTLTDPGYSSENEALPSPESLKDEPSIGDTDDKHDAIPAEPRVPAAEAQGDLATADAENEEVADESQPLPRRMRTRAQAQATSDKSASSHTRSPSPTPWVPPIIHPLFLMPESARLDRDFGLPPNEAEDMRRLLTAYVQKQEEVVRGAEKLCEGLLRAERMRQTVFKWCKAEGHIGEMSDGEDWYDKEEWGLEEDLKKGHEDEEEDNTAPGKKTRKTRHQ